MSPDRPMQQSDADAPSLHRAIDQSEQVKEKVEEAAAELTVVNDTLKEQVAVGVPLVQVRQALGKSEAVEQKVHEAALDLVDVNEALAAEVGERDALEHRVSEIESALSESQSAEQKAKHRALHDVLTDLPNAALFLDRLETALEQARRHDWRLAVMFIDLDGFKAINDTHGHDVGDRVLQATAQRLGAFVRGGDSVGRRGGDEFLVLALEIQDDASAMTVATTLRDRIAEPADVEALTLSVGASIGLAIFPEDGLTAEELLKRADVAMYVAKKGKFGVARHRASGKR